VLNRSGESGGVGLLVGERQEIGSGIRLQLKQTGGDGDRGVWDA